MKEREPTRSIFRVPYKKNHFEMLLSCMAFETTSEFARSRSN